MQANRMIAAAGALLAGLLAATGARADVHKSEDIAYYEISGETVDELRASIQANSTANGFDAYTGWNINWTFDMIPAGGACALDNVQVYVSVRIDFPELVDEEDTPDDVVERWDAYAEVLMEHEQGHVANGEQAAEEIDEALSEFEIDGGCGSIEAQANDHAMTFIRAANERDLEYDRVTDHGATQGARFP